jgi:hypothetical protein
MITRIDEQAGGGGLLGTGELPIDAAAGDYLLPAVGAGAVTIAVDVALEQLPAGELRVLAPIVGDLPPAMC